jgi:hypothetical protein
VVDEVVVVVVVAVFGVEVEEVGSEVAVVVVEGSEVEEAEVDSGGGNPNVTVISDELLNYIILLDNFCSDIQCFILLTTDYVLILSVGYVFILDIIVNVFALDKMHQ